LNKEAVLFQIQLAPRNSLGTPHICTYTHILTHAQAHTHYTHMHIHTYTHMHVPSKEMHAYSQTLMKPWQKCLK